MCVVLQDTMKGNGRKLIVEIFKHSNKNFRTVKLCGLR